MAEPKPVDPDFIKKCRPLGSEVKVQLEIYDEPLERVVKLVSCLMGKNILVASRLPKVKISIFAPHDADAEALERLFLATLTQHGLTLIERGEALQIIEIGASDYIPPVLALEATPPESDAFFTQTIPLKHARASKVLKALKPITRAHTRMSVHGASNSLILVDSGINLRRLRALIRDLDVPKAARSRSKPRSRKPAEVAEAAEPKTHAEVINEVDSGVYEVKRAGLPELSDLATQARVIPHYSGGVHQGFKLVGVRPGSLYRALGLRSGDVVLSVNAEPLSSPSQALEIFTKLKDAQRISLKVQRRDKTLTLEYRLK